MKKYFFISLLFFSLACFADSPTLIQPTTALINGTATYADVLVWSKQRILQENSKESSKIQLLKQLHSFPLTTDAHCGKVKLLFIQNSPQCGNVNCPFLMFKETQSDHSKKTYKYIDEVKFGAMRLYCFPNNKYYLVTSLQHTNAESFLTVDEFKNDKLTPIGTHQIDYSNKDVSHNMDLLWDMKLTEKQLLNLVK